MDWKIIEKGAGGSCGKKMVVFTKRKNKERESWKKKNSRICYE